MNGKTLAGSFSKINLRARLLIPVPADVPIHMKEKENIKKKFRGSMTSIGRAIDPIRAEILPAPGSIRNLGSNVPKDTFALINN